MPDNFTPAEVAKKVGKSTTTVRRLTSEYADWLSDKATPGKNGLRRYTTADVETLSLIVAMRDDGRPEDEIIRVLESGVIPSKVAANVATMPPQPPTASPQPVIVKVDATAIAAQIEPLTAAVRESNASMDRHAAALERLATSLIVFGALLLVITLITLAVASGWIG